MIQGGLSRQTSIVSLYGWRVWGWRVLKSNRPFKTGYVREGVARKTV